VRRIPGANVGQSDRRDSGIVVLESIRATADDTLEAYKPVQQSCLTRRCVTGGGGLDSISGHRGRRYRTAPAQGGTGNRTLRGGVDGGYVIATRHSRILCATTCGTSRQQSTRSHIRKSRHGFRVITGPQRNPVRSALHPPPASSRQRRNEQLYRTRDRRDLSYYRNCGSMTA